MSTDIQIQCPWNGFSLCLYPGTNFTTHKDMGALKQTKIDRIRIAEGWDFIFTIKKVKFLYMLNTTSLCLWQNWQNISSGNVNKVNSMRLEYSLDCWFSRGVSQPGAPYNVFLSYKGITEINLSFWCKTVTLFWHTYLYKQMKNRLRYKTAFSSIWSFTSY